MEELKCPHCGSDEVYVLDCSNIESTIDYDTGKEVIVREMNGCCDSCGAMDLSWVEVYEFVKYIDIKANK